MSTTKGSQLQKRRNRIFTALDVEKNGWISHNGLVYDARLFEDDHPGGAELLTEVRGKDVTALMSDPDSHEHSDSAYQLMQEYRVGRLGTEETIVQEGVVIDENFHPEETDVSKDFEKNQFMDFEKPMLIQLLTSDYSKDYYLQQVHQPRHLPYSAKLFGPWYLEAFTLTPWWIVPLFWLPITSYIFYLSVKQQSGFPEGFGTGSAFANTLLCFFAGNFIWTILEYGVHRFLFHLDAFLPDHPAFLTLHFLLHGVHHTLPMDRYRLVMPPILFASLQYPFTQHLAYHILPQWMANGVIAGAFAFYVLYDTMHYALHHTKLPAYIKQQKAYHMMHHFRNYDAGYGVTSPLWDWVFGTTFDLRKGVIKTSG